MYVYRRFIVEYINNNQPLANNKHEKALNEREHQLFFYSFDQILYEILYLLYTDY